jgi:heterodisulfide reductase subunit A
MERIIANINEELCSGCRICECICPYNALEMKEKDGKIVTYTIEALCKGCGACGACGAACPTKAITMGHSTNEEILAQIQAILVAV